MHELRHDDEEALDVDIVGTQMPLRQALSSLHQTQTTTEYASVVAARAACRDESAATSKWRVRQPRGYYGSLSGASAGRCLNLHSSPSRVSNCSNAAWSWEIAAHNHGQDAGLDQQHCQLVGQQNIQLPVWHLGTEDVVPSTADGKENRQTDFGQSVPRQSPGKGDEASSPHVCVRTASSALPAWCASASVGGTHNPTIGSSALPKLQLNRQHVDACGAELERKNVLRGCGWDEGLDQGTQSWMGKQPGQGSKASGWQTAHVGHVSGDFLDALDFPETGTRSQYDEVVIPRWHPKSQQLPSILQESSPGVPRQPHSAHIGVNRSVRGARTAAPTGELVGHPYCDELSNGGAPTVAKGDQQWDDTSASPQVDRLRGNEANFLWGSEENSVFPPSEPRRTKYRGWEPELMPVESPRAKNDVDDWEPEWKLAQSQREKNDADLLEPLQNPAQPQRALYDVDDREPDWKLFQSQRAKNSADDWEPEWKLAETPRAKSSVEDRHPECKTTLSPRAKLHSQDWQLDRQPPASPRAKDDMDDWQPGWRLTESTAGKDAGDGLEAQIVVSQYRAAYSQAHSPPQPCNRYAEIYCGDSDDVSPPRGKHLLLGITAGSAEEATQRGMSPSSFRAAQLAKQRTGAGARGSGGQPMSTDATPTACYNHVSRYDVDSKGNQAADGMQFGVRDYPLGSERHSEGQIDTVRTAQPSCTPGMAGQSKWGASKDKHACTPGDRGNQARDAHMAAMREGGLLSGSSMSLDGSGSVSEDDNGGQLASGARSHQRVLVACNDTQHEDPQGANFSGDLPPIQGGNSNGWTLQGAQEMPWADQTRGLELPNVRESAPLQRRLFQAVEDPADEDLDHVIGTQDPLKYELARVYAVGTAAGTQAHPSDEEALSKLGRGYDSSPRFPHRTDTLGLPPQLPCHRQAALHVGLRQEGGVAAQNQQHLGHVRQGGKATPSALFTALDNLSSPGSPPSSQSRRSGGVAWDIPWTRGLVQRSPREARDADQSPTLLTSAQRNTSLGLNTRLGWADARGGTFQPAAAAGSYEAPMTSRGGGTPDNQAVQPVLSSQRLVTWLDAGLGGLQEQCQAQPHSGIEDVEIECTQVIALRLALQGCGSQETKALVDKVDLRGPSQDPGAVRVSQYQDQQYPHVDHVFWGKHDHFGKTDTSQKPSQDARGTEHVPHGSSERAGRDWWLADEANVSQAVLQDPKSGSAVPIRAQGKDPQWNSSPHMPHDALTAGDAIPGVAQPGHVRQSCTVESQDTQGQEQTSPYRCHFDEIHTAYNQPSDNIAQTASLRKPDKVPFSFPTPERHADFTVKPLDQAGCDSAQHAHQHRFEGTQQSRLEAANVTWENPSKDLTSNNPRSDNVVSVFTGNGEGLEFEIRGKQCRSATLVEQHQNVAGYVTEPTSFVNWQLNEQAKLLKQPTWSSCAASHAATLRSESTVQDLDTWFGEPPRGLLKATAVDGIDKVPDVRTLPLAKSTPRFGQDTRRVARRCGTPLSCVPECDSSCERTTSVAGTDSERPHNSAVTMGRGTEGNAPGDGTGLSIQCSQTPEAVQQINIIQHNSLQGDELQRALDAAQKLQGFLDATGNAEHSDAECGHRGGARGEQQVQTPRVEDQWGYTNTTLEMPQEDLGQEGTFIGWQIKQNEASFHGGGDDCNWYPDHQSTGQLGHIVGGVEGQSISPIPRYSGLERGCIEGSGAAGPSKLNNEAGQGSTSSGWYEAGVGDTFCGTQSMVPMTGFLACRRSCGIRMYLPLSSVVLDGEEVDVVSDSEDD